MIRVIAGVNGAGKSSIAGSAIKAAGGSYYNPDEEAQRLRQQWPERDAAEINAAVWAEGVRRLRTAIEADHDFTFETTLGGSTIANLLLDAISRGVRVAVWYCGLASPEQHIARVAARVARGGHAIPEAKIRQRWRSSMRNLCRLVAVCAEVAVYDNSLELDPSGRPQLRRLLHKRDGAWVAPPALASMPAWARPVAAVCLGAEIPKSDEEQGSKR
ncbi:MAG: ZTL protein [Deltaproteobacteria bacterium]|nr:ZTL protein [Deltaproteobacteria bacterium]